MTEQLYVRGTLRGHNNWVTQIATNPKFPDMILSSSRGNIYLHISSKQILMLKQSFKRTMSLFHVNKIV